MMYEKPNFIVEVKATDSKDFVFLRITILDHKSKDSIADDIHNMYLDIYEAFNEVYGNSSNLNTAMEVFTDRSEVVMIDDTSFPVIDQRVFAVSEILNEADRLRDETKFLCTLQQGISAKQMEEMAAEKVCLVVPKPYIRTYPAEWQDQIWSIGKFIAYIKEKESV